MWLGALYFTAAGDVEQRTARVLVCAWQEGRELPVTIEGPLHAVPNIARSLRASGAVMQLPRCDACGTPLDLPLD